MGPAEKLLDLVLRSSAHLWHNRAGLDVGGTWQPAPAKGKAGKVKGKGTPVEPGLFAPAAVALYARLLELQQLNAELMARFASLMIHSGGVQRT
jgi:hypothetical protein